MVVHDPEVCTCSECAMRMYECIERGEEVGKAKNNTIEVQKVRTNGELPPFLGVVHRHFEKARPSVVFVNGKPLPTTLVAPLDMLDFLVPAALIAAVDSIEVCYKK